MRSRLSVVALVLAITACSGGAGETTTTTTTTPTTTTVPPTTTTEAPTTTVDDRPRSPINGLPVDDPELLDRRVLAVKIDNHLGAGPDPPGLTTTSVIQRYAYLG